MSRQQADPSSRGIDYADGGISANTVHYPDPEKIAWYHAQWERVDLGEWPEE